MISATILSILAIASASPIMDGGYGGYNNASNISFQSRTTDIVAVVNPSSDVYGVLQLDLLTTYSTQLRYNSSTEYAIDLYYLNIYYDIGFRGTGNTFEHYNSFDVELSIYEELFDFEKLRMVINYNEPNLEIDLYYDGLQIIQPLLDNIDVPEDYIIGGFRNIDYDNGNELIESYINSGSTNYYVGYDDGYRNGTKDGTKVGYANGYGEGYNDAINVDNQIYTIFNGILNVGLLPVNFFLMMFNFNILGINMAGLVSSLLSVAVVVIIIRLILGGKSESGGKK